MELHADQEWTLEFVPPGADRESFFGWPGLEPLWAKPRRVPTSKVPLGGRWLD